MSRRGSLSTSSSSLVDPGSHPGFINLGNTCFLNSVLQASSATQSLKQLLHPDEALDEHDLEVLRSQQSSFLASDKGAVHDLLSSELIKQLSARSKSPVLQLVDEENRKAWSLPGSRRPSSNLESSLIASTLSNSKPSDEAIVSNATSTRSSIDVKSFEPTSGDLPLTTAFRQVLDKTWLDQERSSTSKSKSNRGKAPVVNPKKLLNVMASKYEQYGAYGQQDGHELLRHLLDSLRMEEMDIIKKIHPPDPSSHRRRRRRRSSQNGQEESKEKDMQPFVDSIFCGKLLSCVVCEGCRHVSHCYEDFYDLSLSLRHETDVKTASKRDRMRSMADRWRRATSGKALNGSPSRISAGDSLAMMTDGLMGSVSDTEEVEEKVKRSSSRSGRSIARPKSAAAGQNPAIIDANSRDSAKTFMMKNLQPKGLTVSDLEMDKLTLDKEKEKEKDKDEEKKGATSLLRAVSGRSRPSSRAASPMREEIREVVEGEQHHHHHHLRYEWKPKQSRQGAYLAKLLTEAAPPPPTAQTSALLWGRKVSIPPSSESRPESSPNLSSEGGVGVDEIESQQAMTGLVRALYQFTSVEVLDGVNSFACKRCWRILNPPSAGEKEKLRLRRLRRGKQQDESEESSDDETSSDEEKKELKQLEDEAISRSASIRSSLSMSDGQIGKAPRPHIKSHTESTNTITQESIRRSEIPTIETTSPQTPIDEIGEETFHNGSNQAPLLQAPKARLAQSQGITLGESLSSASSEDDLSEGEKEKELHTTQQNRRIKFGEDVSPSTSLTKAENDRETPLLPSGKAIMRKRSNHSLQRRALKRFLIAETPRVFVFHFKRFQATPRGFSSYSFSNSFKKIDDYVSFPEYLDVRPWLAPPREDYNRDGQLKSSSDPRALARIHREEVEEAQSNEREKKQHRWGWRSKTPIRGSDGKAGYVDEVKTKYRLYAVIVHQGSMSGGHYTAYVLSDHISTTTKSTGSSTLKTLQSQTPTAATTPVPAKEDMKATSALNNVFNLQSAQLGHENGQNSHQSLSLLGLAESKANSSDTVSTVSNTSETESTGADRKSSITSLNGNKSISTAHAISLGSTKSSVSLPKKDTRRWVYTSDTVVRGATIEEVLKAQAYMLFYEQV